MWEVRSRLSELNQTRSRQWLFPRSSSCLNRNTFFELPQELIRSIFDEDRLTKLAEEGDPLALYRLGQCYWWGYFGQMDRDKATQLIVKAAELGHPRAQFALALWPPSFVGDLIQKDSQKEAELWRSIAETTGHPLANYHLGIMLLNGQGVEQDIVAAVRYLEEAAEQGIMAAALEVGVVYLCLRGIKDYKKAFRLLRHVATRAPGKKLRLMALTNFAEIYWRGKGVPKDEEKAMELLHTAADDPEDGDPAAIIQLGMKYGCREQYDLAMKYLLSSQSMPSYGHAMVGDILYFGLGSFQQDRRRALPHIRIAAEDGFEDSLHCLGLYYKNGDVVPRDPQKAYELFAKAAEQGHLISMQEMAALICSGDMGTPIDWRKAAELRHWVYTHTSPDPYAAYTMGNMYSQGSGVPEDHAKALSLLRTAATTVNVQQLIRLKYYPFYAK